MQFIKTYVPVAIIAFWMLGGGIAHFLAPASFYPIVPDFFPKYFVVLASGAVELAIGIAVLIPKTRALAGLAFAALCLCFLPLHLWDFFRPDPVFDPLWTAAVRVAVQFLLIWLGLNMWKGSSKKA